MLLPILLIQRHKRHQIDGRFENIQPPAGSNVDGVECTRLIKEAYPQIRVIILTTFDDDEYVFGALRYGASGYLLKGVSVAELANAVREAAKGGSIIMPGVATKALQMFARMAKGSMQITVTEKQSAELQENVARFLSFSLDRDASQAV